MTSGALVVGCDGSSAIITLITGDFVKVENIAGERNSTLTCDSDGVFPAFIQLPPLSFRPHLHTSNQVSAAATSTKGCIRSRTHFRCTVLGGSPPDESQR